MGLDVYLNHNGSQIEEPSKLYPDHLFKLGYFRSSYNGNGFNSVMHSAGVPDLYEVFMPPKNASRFTPDWKAALLRAQTSMQMWREHLGSIGGDCYVMEETAEGVIGSPEQAMLAYQTEMTRKNSPFDAYSNSVGFFTKTPRRLRAVIGGRSALGRPCVYLVMQKDPLEEGESDWYDMAWQIVVETIEHVLASGKPEQFELYWSA